MSTRMFTTDAQRWHAVQSRDPTASTAFIYAVISTKIYCRPACPARLPRRANVRFYDTVDAATTAGYRPCLRCRPDDRVTTDNNNDGDGRTQQRDAVRRACEYIEQRQRRGETARFPEVAKHVGLSTRYLYGLFRTVLGVTPSQYAASRKLVPDPSTVAAAVAAAVADGDEGAETPSTLSGTVGTDLLADYVGTGDGEFATEFFDWNTLLDPNYDDLTVTTMMLQDYTAFPLQHFDVCGGSVGKPLPVDDASDLMAWNSFDVCWPPLDPLDSLWGLHEG